MEYPYVLPALVAVVAVFAFLVLRDFLGGIGKIIRSLIGLAVVLGAVWVLLGISQSPYVTASPQEIEASRTRILATVQSEATNRVTNAVTNQLNQQSQAAQEAAKQSLSQWLADKAAEMAQNTIAEMVKAIYPPNPEDSIVAKGIRALESLSKQPG